ncbi:MAG: ribosome biogenesis/translation initiation ATPase RLI [Candidatus Micrarchaeota archaeon]|nr:ribosome biogenesis/translation initiation ATPase RLI [Candidatus Micrarchaeota archaeon]
MRIAVIDRDKCTKEQCGYLCQKICPGVRMGDETITLDEEGFPVISEDLCTGCGICPKRCPVGAIKIINLPSEVGLLVFQYGVNAFRLFNLPLPKKNAVVGLVGANGIGKTTALQLLSKKLAPNFGEYARKESEKELLLHFSRHPELQNYFRSMGGGVKLSYKPQNVEKVAEKIKGKVGPILKKADERKVLDEVVKSFELENILDREISHLSGGELQRLSIAIAYMRKADFYYFDEPSSYLDIAQRLKMAAKIKELAGHANVMVVEHDLAVLDYLSDYVHVFYGEEGAYGVVSHSKSSRSGINEYLAGYIKGENVRFRTYEIKFEKSSPQERSKSKIAFEYPAMGKNYGSFSMHCENGEVRKGETIGILGPNAIGKTTFIKMLAGVEEPDAGKRMKGLKVSYKPQYLESDFEGTVAELIANSGINAPIFDSEIRRRLNIDPLMLKQVKNLSGGELQRLSIAICLATDADLYLLDEPSAFLDIEQRLIFASVLKNVMGKRESPAFVVDHDIVLIDSVADALMVFEGESGKSGKAGKPMGKREGMNAFLKEVGVTLRRDKDSHRPRINKQGSQMDSEQKKKGEYYYT